MNLNFLGQGYEVKSENSVGYKLIEFFSSTNFHTFTGISAFASQAGVRGLSNYINTAKKQFKSISVVTGIDQKGTSKEALEELLAIGVNSFVFYQPSITIFHPKIYLFEGDQKSELIIGSSNLTSQGLFTNVEASLHVSIDNTSVADKKIIEQLKIYYRGIFEFSDPNLKKLDKNLIDDLVKSKIVPTEEERKASQDKEEQIEIKETENFITKIFPKRAIAKIPSEFRGMRKITTELKSDQVVQDSSSSYRKELVWESGKLTERALNIPKGSNTNPTGSMYFTKGKTKGIDQRHFFREKVFQGLNWKFDKNSATSHLERAIATFKIIIDGNLKGSYNLTLTHNTNKASRSYEQNNSMTQVSWGTAKKVIANPELIGKTVKLFKTQSDFEFILEIS